MNLSTLEIPPIEAEAKLKEYQGMIASERTAEDEAIAAGYRAAKRGHQVISLPDVMTAGGWFDNGLPKLAICRADASRCTVDISWGGRLVVFGDDPHAENRGAMVGTHTVRVLIDGRPRDVDFSLKRRGQTPVPLVPPKHRPRPRRLVHCHILWEVEKWDNTVPRDPALLRHIRGDLWAVLATWDLTDLERAVLSAR